METQLLGPADRQPEGSTLYSAFNSIGCYLIIRNSMGITDEIFITKEQALKLAKIINEKYGD